MNTIEVAKQSLIGFCRNSDQRVYAFKGAWGVGKSYLVRRLLTEASAELPDYVSYISVFGLSTLREVQDRIRDCMERRKAAFISKCITYSLRFFSQAKPSIPYVSLPIPDLSSTVFWHIVKAKHSLLVIDDIERASSSLQLDELLGLVSSIVENSHAKILLVFNDAELKEDQMKSLTRVREKVIDGEFAYCPTIKELASEFLHDDTLVDTVVSCLAIRGGPNIRMIRRIKHAIQLFTTTMVEARIPFDADDIAQMVKVVWFFYISPTPLKEDVILNMRLWGHIGDRKEDDATQEDKEAFRLAQLVSLRSSNFDKLMLEYLDKGFYPDDSLKKFADEDARHRHDQELRTLYDNVAGLYDKNFLASDSVVCDAIEHLLDERVCDLGLSQMRFLLTLLDKLGRPSAGWWLRHVKGVIASRCVDTCRTYLSALPEGEAKKTVQDRIEELSESFDPKAAICRITGAGSWNPSDLHRLNSLDNEFYRSWFQTAEGDLFTTLKTFLALFEHAATSTPGGEIHAKLVGVLTGLASESVVNSLRVKYLLNIPIEEVTSIEPPTPPSI